MAYNIAIIGSGYIGLVLGMCLADFDHKVNFADIDSEKVNKLNKGIVTIYEPGLENLLKKNLNNQNISFTTDIANVVKNSSVIFIAVNTPSDKDGSADISAVKAVALEIAKNLNENKIVCIKSTVPVGTHKIVDDIIKENNKNFSCEIVSIPEFLREGTAISDFINPDRVIIGTKSHKTFETLKDVFKKINCPDNKIIMTDNASAETIKYVANSFLALKISFINEIANFCDKVGVDVFSVVQGIGLDHRIGELFLKPGPKWGGSCFPKDVLALYKMAHDSGINLHTLQAAMSVNELQNKIVLNKLKKLLNNDLANKTVGILGLAFKANTDDIRYSAAIDVIKELKKENVNIKVYDPQAMENMKREFLDLHYCKDSYDCVKHSDAILLLTEWKEFIDLDFDLISKTVKQKNILDTRNVLSIEKLKELNFNIDNIGRSIIAQD